MLLAGLEKFDLIIDPACSREIMTGGADAISKAINKSTPGQPRQIRSQVGLTDDPVPEGKHIAQPECVQIAACKAKPCANHLSGVYCMCSRPVPAACAERAALRGFGLQTSP